MVTPPTGGSGGGVVVGLMVVAVVMVGHLVVMMVRHGVRWALSIYAPLLENKFALAARCVSVY